MPPDLRGYDPAEHSYILFDNVNGTSFALGYRAMCQANNDIRTLGDGKTGCYSYDARLWKVPIVVTVDTSANWGQQEPWIYAHSKYIFLEGPGWIEQV